MGYYAYEYEVLMKLQDKYRIESVTIDSDRCYTYNKGRDLYGNLIDIKVVMLDNGRWITLNFQNDFHVKIDGNRILGMFELDITSDETVFVIEDCIRKLWLNQIKK